jgi:hypothetical protein
LGFGVGNFSQKQQSQNTNQEEDLFGDDDGFLQSAQSFANMPVEVLLKEDVRGKAQNKGIQVKGGFRKSDRTANLVQLALDVTNKTGDTLNDFVI